MTEPQETWRRLGEEITRIGERFRDHYQAAAGTGEADGGEGEAGSGARSGSVGEDMRTAFDALGRSLDRVFASVGSAFRDPSVQDEARRATNTLVDALSGSLEEIGKSLRHLIEAERPDDSTGTWEPSGVGPQAVGDPDEPAPAGDDADPPVEDAPPA